MILIFIMCATKVENAINIYDSNLV